MSGAGTVTPAPETSVTRRASAGVVWLTLQTWVSRLGGFVTVAVLARLLTPEDFGLVAIAMTVLPIVYLLADLGFTTYIVQADRVDRTTASTAFWSSTAIGLVLCGVIVASAPLLAGLFGAAQAAPIVGAIAPAVLVVAMAATPVALLRREMRFRALSIQNAVAGLLGQAVALVLAFGGAGVWALVAQVLVQQTTTLVLAWIAARWVPRVTVSVRQFRAMLGFGVKVMSTDLAAMSRLWAENAVISRTLGAASLGVLGIAYRLVQTARDLTGAALAPVSVVAFAKIRADAPRVLPAYRRAVRATYAATAPALAGLVVLAPQAVPLIFGDQWDASIPLVQALAIAALVGLAATIDHGLCYGLGHPGRWLSYSIVAEVAALAATVALVASGLTAVAWGAAGVAAACTVGRWFLVARVIRVPARAIASVVLLPLVIVLVTVLVGTGVALLLAAAPAIVIIAVTAVTMVAVHLLGVRLLLPDTAAELVMLVRARIPRRRGPARREER